MKNFTILMAITFSLIFASSNSFANHCSGGHKEIKDTKDSSEETNESKSN